MEILENKIKEFSEADFCFDDGSGDGCGFGFNEGNGYGCLGADLSTGDGVGYDDGSGHGSGDGCGECYLEGAGYGFEYDNGQKGIDTK